jgi:hypothetical protein
MVACHDLGWILVLVSYITPLRFEIICTRRQSGGSRSLKSTQHGQKASRTNLHMYLASKPIFD